MQRVSIAAAALAMAVLAGWTTAAADRVFFMTLPREALPYAVGANGFMVAGTYYGLGAFSWLPTTGDKGLGGLGAAAISGDGKTIGGSVLDARLEKAAVWRTETGWRVLGGLTPTAAPCDSLLSSIYDGSADGRVMVGLGWNGCAYARAFRWEESTGMVDLGSLNNRSTRANGISADGRTIVGWQEDTATGVRTAAKWVNLRQEMIPPVHEFLGEAHAVNSDGTIIVGDNCDPGVRVGASPAWVWTPETGVKCYPVAHPDWLPRNTFHRPLMLGVSDDGRVIGGSYAFGQNADSLLWLDGRVYFLKEYLAMNGLGDAFKDWVNTGFITDVSPDGRTLVGYGAAPLGFTGFIVILPQGAK